MEAPKYPGLSIIRVFLSIKSLEIKPHCKLGGGLEGGFPLPLTNFPPFPELHRNSFTNLIRTVAVSSVSSLFPLSSI